MVTEVAVTDGIVVDEQRRRYVSIVVDIEELARRHARKKGSPGTDVDHPGDFSWGRSSSMGPQESMTRASAALAEWKP